VSIHVIYRYVTSWIETREYAVEKSNLVILFDKYIPPCLENIRNRFKKIIPITEMSHIQMLCHLLECILVPANTPTDCPKEWYELYFTFVCIWSFGAAIYQEQVRTKIGNSDFKFTVWKISNF
jgi:dynein heavy chain, axonemal